jgi:GMP reductase
MRIIDDTKLDFSDVLIAPKRSQLTSRKEAQLSRKFTFKYSKHSWEGIPIVASNMDHTGTIAMCHVLMEYPMLTALCKFVESTEWGWNKNIIRTIGLEENLDDLTYDSDTAPWICLDIANGYTERFCDFVDLMRRHEATKDKIIIAGNVCTPEATEQIVLAGADVVKIGIGPGSVCTTRKMTGIGYPQLSAVIECADAAHGLSGHVMSDGGCTVPGDIAKAFGAGADFVMLGGMLAGHKECEGEVLGNHRGSVMEFYGMSSEEAQIKYYGKKESYKASEGKKVQVPYRGNVKDTMDEILGGLRSSCTYAGARTLKALPKCATFVKVNRQLNEVFS